MSGEMPRNPAVYNGLSRHRRIPIAGSAIWFPMLDDLLTAGIDSLPTMTEVGTPSGAKWGTDGLYTFQTTNTTNCLNAQDDDVDGLYMNQVMSLIGMEGYRIIAMEASYTVDPAGTSTIFFYGRNSIPASAYGFAITSSEAPQFIARGRGNSAGTGTNTTLTASSGTFTQFKNQGRFAMVLGVRPVSASTVDVELRVGNGTLSALYTGSAIDVIQSGVSGTHPPGAYDGITMSDFGGLTLGARNSSSVGTNDNFWGRGTASVAQIGNFQARSYDYDVDLVGDVLAQMLAHPHDFVLLD